MPFCLSSRKITKPRGHTELQKAPGKCSLALNSVEGESKIYKHVVLSVLKVEAQILAPFLDKPLYSFITYLLASEDTSETVYITA